MILDRAIAGLPINRIKLYNLGKALSKGKWNKVGKALIDIAKDSFKKAADNLGSVGLHPNKIIKIAKALEHGDWKTALKETGHIAVTLGSHVVEGYTGIPASAFQTIGKSLIDMKNPITEAKNIVSLLKRGKIGELVKKIGTSSLKAAITIGGHMAEMDPETIKKINRGVDIAERLIKSHKKIGNIFKSVGKGDI